MLKDDKRYPFIRVTTGDRWHAAFHYLGRYGPWNPELQVTRYEFSPENPEGVDERLVETEIDEEWSLGDFVLSGGELAAGADGHQAVLRLDDVAVAADHQRGVLVGDRQQRFELAFAGSGSVDINERDGLYSVTLRFPLRTDSE